MQPINADAFGVAALSALTAIVFKLIENGTITKNDAEELYSSIALAKMSKALAYDSQAEKDAAVLLTTLATEINIRYPDGNG